MMQRYVTMVLMCGLCVMISACIFTDQPSGKGEPESCREDELCDAGASEVCGEDGEVYACEELATCEAVAIDDSGQACGKSFCSMTLPVGCNLFCAEYLYDSEGCRLCMCANTSSCPTLSPCSDGQDRVCNGEDANGCPICVCPNT